MKYRARRFVTCDFDSGRFEELWWQNSREASVAARKVPSIRELYNADEISKIISAFIVVPIIVSPANDRSNNSCNLYSSPFANRWLLFVLAYVHLTRKGPYLVADLGAEDLWHIGNTRRPQFTAHYLAHPPLRLAFSSTSVIHRRLLFARLEPFPPFFFRLVYRRGCAIFFTSASISFLFPLTWIPILPLPLVFFFLFLFLFLCLLPFFFFFQYNTNFFFLFLLLVLSFFIFFIIWLHFFNFFLIYFSVSLFFLLAFLALYFIFFFYLFFLFTLTSLFYFQFYIYWQHVIFLLVSLAKICPSLSFIALLGASPKPTCTNGGVHPLSRYSLFVTAATWLIWFPTHGLHLISFSFRPFIYFNPLTVPIGFNEFRAIRRAHREAIPLNLDNRASDRMLSRCSGRRNSERDVK